MDATKVRAILEAHSQGDGHRGFCNQEGAYFEGYYWVDEEADVIHFASGGPQGGWERAFAFTEINLATLIPSVKGFMMSHSETPFEED